MLVRSQTGFRVREHQHPLSTQSVKRSRRPEAGQQRAKQHPKRATGANLSLSAPSIVVQGESLTDSTRKTSWGDLDYSVKLRILELCDCDKDVHAVGNADPSLIPHIVAAPALARQQLAYNKAVVGKTGLALIEGLRQHLPAFWARGDSDFWLDENESMGVIQEICRLRSGHGPVPILRIQQQNCQERLEDLPDDVHLDVRICDDLFLRGRTPWTVPPQASCLFFSRNSHPNGTVLGRHAFVSSRKHENIYISDLDLRRGRLDLSKIAGCGFLELYNCTVGLGSFGLRWPAEVSTLRIAGCTFSDQTESFDLPDGLKYLDVCNTPIASLANDYKLPTSVRTIDICNSTISRELLPISLPPALEELYCFTDDFAPQLQPRVWPQSLVRITISDASWPSEQPRRLKLAKRNWQRQLKKQHPHAKIRIQ